MKEAFNKTEKNEEMIYVLYSNEMSQKIGFGKAEVKDAYGHKKKHIVHRYIFNRRWYKELRIRRY